jgi:serine phosphatase RsbU (regulator of sigma subunit)
MRWGISLLRGPGRAVALGVVAAALLLRAFDFGIVVEARLRGFDLEEWVLPRASDPARVRVIDIDEKSLAQYGQWPWPRTRLAKLVRRIAEGNPRVLGIDIVLADRDRLSPPEIARELPDLPPSLADALAGQPPSDRDLAEAMRTVPTVLALVPGREEVSPPSGMTRPAPIRQAGGDPTPFLSKYESLLRPLAELTDAAQGAGAIAAHPDADGTLRRLALAVSHRGTVIPSFALEVLRVGSAERSILIETGANGIEDIRVGGVTIPTDAHGRAILHFARPLARYISASDVLDPAFDVTQLKGKTVLLGVTGLGVIELQETPLGLDHGIDIQAQLIESMLLGNLLHRPWMLDWIELGAALVAGLAAIFLLNYQRPARAVTIALAIVAGLVVLQLALLQFADFLVDATYPALTLLAAFGVMLVGALRAAQEELHRQREATHRFEGELAAAQAIQMGLLPRRFPAFPDHPEIDVYAHIEPARMVGGDLYDYLLIDRDHRLFFLVADVSGKGAPAALLMAGTKEIVREAVLKFGMALERILAEANQKTATASADLQSEGGVFVTAFAGILDLNTGEVIYASAGHDSPFVLGGDEGPRQLMTEGGPPLGAVDGFSYPIDRDQVELGEVLLLYTDGVTEAENAENTLYGHKRLDMVLAKVPTADARSVVAAVVDDVRSFISDAEQADDITLLALRRSSIGR